MTTLAIKHDPYGIFGKIIKYTDADIVYPTIFAVLLNCSNNKYDTAYVVYEVFNITLNKHGEFILMKENFDEFVENKFLDVGHRKLELIG